MERLSTTKVILQDWDKHVALASIRNRQDLEREIERLREIDTEEASVNL